MLHVHLSVELRCVILWLFDRDLSGSRSDDSAKRKSVESLPSHRNVRLSVRPFDDNDDAETPLYSSGSVVWNSSSEAILDVEETHPRQQRGSASDSCGSDQAPDSDRRRLSDRDMASAETSDAVLSSDCSLSSDQSPVHHTELLCTTTAALAGRVDPPLDGLGEVVSCSGVGENADVASESEPVPGGTDDQSQRSSSLLDEINDHLKQSHGRELLLGTVTGMSSGFAAKRSPDDMSLLDIDNALAEVMSGLELLGRSRGMSLDHGPVETTRHSVVTTSSLSSSPPGRVSSPRTPDLVIGLPQCGQSSTSPRPLQSTGSPPPATGQLTSAEMFANVDRSTIKKSAPSTSTPSSAEIWTSPGRPLLRTSPSGAPVSDRMMSVGELSYWSPAHCSGDAASRMRGSPARSQSCRAAERQSDQTWSTLWMTSTEIQRDREFVRAVAPQFTAAGRQPLSPSSPGPRDHADLPRLSSFTSAGTGPWKDPAPSYPPVVVATLPRDTTGGGPKTPVKVKPPVMKKPARSAEMMRRLSEYQQQQQQRLTDSACSGSPK